jgi:aarF domain-containing kinase
MAGRRLIDAAKLFNASKSIAKAHINLRSQQLDTYSKTSTLAKAVKDQTDRVTLTAKAAIILAQRFNEPPPSYTKPTASDETPQSQDGSILKKGMVDGEWLRADVKEGLEQNHGYDRSGRNTHAEPPAEELEIKQEEAQRSPLPDGTIPPSGIILPDQSAGQDTYSRRPMPEATKQPLAEEQTGGRDGIDGLRPLASEASTKPISSERPELSSVEARKLQRQSEFQIPSRAGEMQPSSGSTTKKLSEGHDRDVFYTRSAETKPEYSSLPRAKIPKHTEDKQTCDAHVQDGQLNQDVFYATSQPGQAEAQKEQIPQQAAVPEQEQVPEGINTDVFRSPKVAKMLSGNPYIGNPYGRSPYKGSPQLDLKGARKSPVDHTKLAVDMDQATFYVRSSQEGRPAELEQTLSSTQASAEKEMRDFASQLAKDAEASSATTSPVREFLHPRNRAEC